MTLEAAAVHAHARGRGFGERLVAASRVLAWIGGALVLFAAGWIAVDVMLRLLLNTALPASVELGGYVLAVSCAWTFAFALFAKAHVRVDTVYVLLPLRWRPWLDLAALATLAFVVAALCWRAVELTRLSWDFGSRSLLRLPLWVPQGLWTFGLVFFLVSIVALIGMVAQALRRGDLARIRQLASVDSVAEELETELRSLQQRRDVGT